MNVRLIQKRITELKSLEKDLIRKLEKEHQIVDASALLEALHERNAWNKMLEMEVVKQLEKEVVKH